LKRLGLKNPIYLPTSTYGHFGRDHYTKDVEVFYQDADTFKKVDNGKEKIYKTVEFFPWEKLDFVDIIRKEFGI
jgi:S-adenosylmethionine synthetase